MEKKNAAIVFFTLKPTMVKHTMYIYYAIGFWYLISHFYINYQW